MESWNTTCFISVISRFDKALRLYNPILVLFEAVPESSLITIFQVWEQYYLQTQAMIIKKATNVHMQ